MMKKARHPSGDCGSETSGYQSNTETQTGESHNLLRIIPHNISSSADVLSRSEALHLLRMSHETGTPLQSCPNSERGCPVKSYPRVLGIHTQVCQFPEVRGKLIVKSKLNIQGALSNKFSPFCSAWEASRKVVFLYKLTKEGDSIKICAQHYAKEHTFTLTLYDKKDCHIHKIESAKTGLDLHKVPPWVFAEVGNCVKYKIQMTK